MKEFKVVVKLHGEEEMVTFIEGESKLSVRNSIFSGFNSQQCNLMKIGDLIIPTPNLKAIEVVDKYIIDASLVKFFIDGKARRTGVTTSNLNLALNNNGVFVGLNTKHLQEQYQHIKIIDFKDLNTLRGTSKPVYFDPAVIWELLK